MVTATVDVCATVPGMVDIDVLSVVPLETVTDEVAGVSWVVVESVVPRISHSQYEVCGRDSSLSLIENCKENSPVLISVQALISNTTSLGERSLVVEMIVISTRDTFLSDGIWVESTVAGFLLSSLGLVDD